MSYQVLARKWRPAKFSEVVGQEHVVRTLCNAVESGKIHHAFLFTGARGVGKTTIARIWAKSLNCTDREGAEPCGTCSTCQAIDAGNFVDMIEVDAASRTGVDDTRSLLETVRYPPSIGRYKVYLFDEAHMFSISSFNALLKTLEEPPARVSFLLATTNQGKIPATVLSRCLQFNLKLLDAERISEQLKRVLAGEDVPFDDRSIELLAVAAKGSLRDALSLADQAITFAGGRLDEELIRRMLGTIEGRQISALLKALVSSDIEQTMQCVGEIAQHSTDYSGALDALIKALHSIALAQLAPGAAARMLRGDPQKDDYFRFAEQLSKEDVQLFYQMGLNSRRDISLAPSGRVGLEMALLRMLVFMPDSAVHKKQPSSEQEQQPVEPVETPADNLVAQKAQRHRSQLDQMRDLPAVKTLVGMGGEIDKSSVKAPPESHG